MEITFKTNYQDSLFMYIELYGAVEHLDISNKLSLNDGYHTEWSELLSNWSKRGLYNDYVFDTLVGRHKIIYTLEFIGGRFKAQELIPELNNYFNKFAWTSVDYVVCTPISEIGPKIAGKSS